jgi:hypothetical protein
VKLVLILLKLYFRRSTIDYHKEKSLNTQTSELFCLLSRDKITIRVSKTYVVNMYFIFGSSAFLFVVFGR